MLDNVKLTYKRVGESYEGVMTSAPDEPPLTFAGFSFAVMMMNVHRLVTLHPEAGLLITRTDREGLLPAQLEPKLLELLRTDPLAYIKANTLPDRVIDLSPSKRTSKLVSGEKYTIPQTSGLRHGHDTLAAAFGERVYIKMRDRRFEHPATGRWADMPTIVHWLGNQARDLEVFVTDQEKGMGWASVDTKSLLQTKTGRFFLPREWNKHGSWITREQLQTLLDKYLKEKNDVTRK